MRLALQKNERLAQFTAHGLVVAGAGARAGQVQARHGERRVQVNAIWSRSDRCAAVANASLHKAST